MKKQFLFFACIVCLLGRTVHRSSSRERQRSETDDTGRAQSGGSSVPA